MPSHTVFQRLKTYGKEQKILSVESYSNQPTSVSFVYFNRFAYEICLDLDPIIPSCRCNITKLFKFPAKIRTLIEGPTQGGIFALTEDGDIWKLNLPTIVEKEKPLRYVVNVIDTGIPKTQVGWDTLSCKDRDTSFYLRGPWANRVTS